MVFRSALQAILVMGHAVALDSEIISDLVTSSTDEARALDIKNQDFWQPMLDSAETAKMSSAYTHLSVYEEIESAVLLLPEENTHVRGLLEEGLRRLRRADQLVFQQALESSEVASQQLLAGPQDGSAFSFMTGGQNYFAQAIRRFVGFGRYGERLGKQVHQRQAEVTPVLRGAVAVTGNVLVDCREGSKLAFDVLKYDIYNSGVPKTPDVAKSAANRLVDAIAETRHNFMQGVISAAGSLAQDSENKEIPPTVTVTRALVDGLDLPGSQKDKTNLFHF